ncbi:hypothetical protein VTP01DRAFT_7934 [Rhizomucor pusillus]|uniref:uncharacterized protein n=1 Tax=Rhizomucor pusillus TaxID=4840 RepID=UPI0037445BAD
MDEDAIDYIFDDVSSFYAELDDILRYPCSGKEDVERITTRYIRFLTRFQDEFCQTSSEQAQAAYKLIDSNFFLEHSTLILSHIIQNHALRATSADDLLMVYSLLIYAGKEDPRWMKYIVSDARRDKQNLLFRKIIREIESGFGSIKWMAAAVVLVFEMSKVSRVRAADLEIITPSLINCLLDIVESTLGDADETFNYDVIRLILVLNEQFVMAPNHLISNVVLDVLSTRLGTANTFGSNLIFMLNRSDDACVKLLILKLLYCIFTRSSLYEYFYTNDLYVLVDVILREVCNLGEERDAEALRDAYLRVLRPCLTNTQLKYTPYKQNEIHRTLCSMITPCSYRTADPTLQRLVQRILEEWWEKICNHPVAPLLGVDVKAGAMLASSQNNAVLASSRSPSPYPFIRTSSSSSSTSSTTSFSPTLPSSSSPSPSTPPAKEQQRQSTSKHNDNNASDVIVCAGAY